MENADTFDAPKSTGDDKSPPWADTPISPPDAQAQGLPDNLPTEDEAAKDSLASLLAIGTASKEEVKWLYDLCLTKLLDDQKEHHNKDAAMTALAQAIHQAIPAAPLSPERQNGEPQDLFDPSGGDEIARNFLNKLRAAGLERCELKSAHEISSLAGNEPFEKILARVSELMRGKPQSQPQPSQQQQQQHLGGKDTNGSMSSNTTRPDTARIDGTQQGQQAQALQQNSHIIPNAPHFHTLLPPQAQNFQHGPSFTPAAGPDHSSHAHLHYDIAPKFGQQGDNHYIVPTALAQPALTAANVNFSTMAPGQDRAIFEQQNSLPSPITQASSNQSEAPSPPNINNTGGGAEVICPLHDPDGRPCGKRCSGAKPYRSIQEHIRRAHPDRYIAGLPANEESFQAMVNTEGVICPIPRPDGSACGTRCTGSKPYRTVQDHIRDTHPEHFVPALPANEASFRIMVEKPETITCPLPMPDGSACTKRCFGDKRYRSIQEHIRRAHPERYVSGLSANAESFLRMTSGCPVAPSLSQQNSASSAKPAVADLSRHASSHSTHSQGKNDVSPAPPAGADAIAELQDHAPVAVAQPDMSPAFDGPVWPSPTQQTTGTVAPEMLTVDDFQQATQTYFSWQIPAQPLQQAPAFQQAHFPNPHYSAMSLAAASVQDSDPTLTRDLFKPQAILGEMHTDYGNTYLAGLQQQQAGLDLFQHAPAQVGHQLTDHQAAELELSGWPLVSQQAPTQGLSGELFQMLEPSPQKRKREDSENGLPGDRQQKPRTKFSQPSMDILTANHANPVSQANGSCISPPATVAPSLKTPTKPKPTPNNHVSPYFSGLSVKQNDNADKTATAATPSPKTKRPPRNTVSALPMPPLTADQFGLVQERLAKDPFRLLIAIQFLVRTPGKTSIPVFEDVMKRWPTPQDLAAANPDDIKGMIRKLGLCNQRCEAIQKYARMWCEQPPDKDARYGVKDYPRKGDGKDVRAREVFGAEQELGQDTQTTEGPNHAGSEPTVTTKARGHGTAWEIGHLTFGRYAIDSWRIFCRDVLLGRAEDWKGAGRGPTFQPEWMRVLPEDKELRAYLRWMWMKEGWWWDPHTGDRTLLNNTMVQAVNEGCVAWDGEGELQIVDTPVRNGVVNSHAGGSVQQAGAANGS